ncbi:hypothetical protein CHLRE_08g362650v5 [Chlamydomonas reinhardtii]|uniref:Uncharacterized protein n=1 Tax=Chlamydomonas reinhardtii TaxID=3055 RepID=A0A2K3DGM1_CHLRE|nr:uncharacterized protein CHLRE_08g362650v5 [Chlamydomonas reinhardtii]PNW79678.1 hypothetical protein CHLRE_08g362650v5 [Chlamydomonas reinhardtii]8BDA_G Chain G, Intraflagellar transport particle protein 140 [Chlamydomonas reinhardtii]
MEIYYTTKISGRAGVIAGWSKAPGYPSLLAVALSPNAVGIYNEEGRPLDPNNEANIKNVRGTECAKIAWHPLLPLLAIGWKDGAISFWNAEERKLEEDSKIHRNTISSMTWTASGDRLITGDENGRISMWKTDRLMRPIHVVAYDEPGAVIRHTVVGLPEEMPDTNSQVVVAFYVADAQERAVVKWCNDQGYSGVVVEMSEGVHTLVHYPERDQLLVVGSSCTLNVLTRDEQLGTWVTASKMKFATGTGEAATGLQVAWAGNHTLASASEKDNVVRMYNFDTEDNYVLNLEQDSGLVSRVVCLAYDDRYNLLAVGTTDGRVMMYKFNQPNLNLEPVLDFAKCWEMQPAFFVGNRALAMEWGPFPRLMVVACNDAINVCRKTMLSYKFRDGVAIMQVAVDRVVLENLEVEPQRPPGRLQLQDMQLLGLDLSKGLLLVWDGERAEVYKVTETNDIMPASQFETTSRCMAINNDSVYRAAENKVEVVNMAGTVKQTLMFDDNHGSPTSMDVARDYLAVVTSANIVRILKVAGREAKPHAGPAPLCPPELKDWKVMAMRANGNGNLVAALVVGPEPARAVRLVVWCGETNTHHVHDFTPEGRQPVQLMFDTVEPKLLVVQCTPVFTEANVDERPHGDAAHVVDCAIIFVDPDKGILLQEYQPIHTGGATACIGSCAPHLLTNKKSMVQPAPGSGAFQPFTSNVSKAIMTSFQGMQDSDDKTRRALLDFSFNLATGNMDEAFRSVKAIKNPAVWENMAHMCIRNKRLDVAEHCLSNMEHARGARALREAKSIEEADARVATVAVHLGMIEDAKKLYIACERYDLLNQLYRACGQWDKALEVAEKNDRIHLKSTHYAYGQFMERQGDMEGARKHYEAAGCGLVEVPRMLFEAEKFTELQNYIQANDSRELILWWGKYLESLGEYAKALDCYRKAGDSLSMVRIHCFQRDWKAAEDEVTNSADNAASFHLARQYEASGRIPEAIRYYTLAKRYSHGVRLAKTHELDSDLMNLALKSTPAVMIDTADYLFAKGQHEKAATLYMKGGKLSKAVEMCFQAQLFDVLQHITDDMTPEKSDPNLYNKCAEFFMGFGHNDKAVKMLIAAQQYGRALELCVEHDVSITEEMADSMTPDKNAAVSADERNNVICRIAKVAKRQGNFQLAAKKYTQAGDKVKAMKALLRGGDAEKIIFFAGVSRQKDIYLMAANYLQTLNWHSDPELMKHIISFYTKAAAWESLASFYEACAQIEVDEYRDYEKALQAMREAAKYVAKSKNDDRDARVGVINDRIAVAEQFVAARQLIGSNPQEALRVCDELLRAIPPNSQDLEAGIRIGDVYALMVEYWYEARNPNEAYKAIEAMRRRGIILSPYLDTRMVEDIYRSLGVALDMAEERRGPANLGLRESDAGAFVEEEVADEDD